MERIPGASAFDLELRELTRERDECLQLRERARALESERARLEAELEAASERSASMEEELEALLARLRVTERQLTHTRTALEARAGVEERLDRTLARKHALLEANAPEHPVGLTLARLRDDWAAAQRAQQAAFVRLHMAQEVHEHLQQLLTALPDPKDREATSAAERACEMARRAARDLPSLGEDASVEGEASLSETLVARYVGVFSGHDAVPWYAAAMSCRERVATLIALLHTQEREHLQLGAACRRQYQTSVLQA